MSMEIKLEDRVEELEACVKAMRDDMEVFRQNLTELSRLVETENVPLQVFEREIRFLKTIIEEAIKK